MMRYLRALACLMCGVICLTTAFMAKDISQVPQFTLIGVGVLGFIGALLLCDEGITTPAGKPKDGNPLRLDDTARVKSESQPLPPIDTLAVEQPVDAAEEMMLQAQGDVLAWTPAGKPGSVRAEVAEGQYHIVLVSSLERDRSRYLLGFHPEATYKSAIEYIAPDRQRWAREMIGSLADAKAACERHHATGRWE